MFLPNSLLFLLLILIYEFIVQTNQNDLSFSTKNNSKQRLKRFLSRKSKLNRKTNQEDEILLNSAQFNPNPSQKQTKPRCTAHHIDEINRVLSKKDDDYYNILRIKKPATKDIINNAYRQIMLQVHPDKCNTNRAKQAAQKLNNVRMALLNKMPSNNNQQQERTSGSPTNSSSFNQNNEDDVPDTVVVPYSPSPAEQENSTSKNNSFFPLILIAGVILIILIIIFLIYWKKRQTKKQKFSLNHDSPISNNDDSELSTTDDDE